MSKSDPPIDAEHARELLKRERDRIELALSGQQKERASQLQEIDTETNAEDDGEMIEDDAVDDALAEQLRAELEAVERAEKRLEEGTYGFSIESGDPIPAERLETIPWAERTPPEQQEFERTHGRAL
jgi:DnaK suppressor protein